MNIIVLKAIKAFKPPFHNDLLEIFQWIKPITAKVTVKGETVGGIVISPKIVSSSMQMPLGKTTITLPNGRRVKVDKTVEHKDSFLANHFLEKELKGFVGLPNRTEEVVGDTFLFSYIDVDGGRFTQYQAQELDKTKTFETSKKGRVVIEDIDINSSFPVIDRFGYLVGVNVGIVGDETVCSHISLTTSKL